VSRVYGTRSEGSGTFSRWDVPSHGYSVEVRSFPMPSAPGEMILVQYTVQE
jgi:hypothetical protein